MRTGIALALSLALGAGLTYADEPAVVHLSLSDALARARTTSGRLAELRAREEGGEAVWRAARSARLPQIDLQAAYTRNSGVPELVLPGTPPRVLFPNIPDTYRLHAGLTLPLYTGGRIGNTVAAAREQATAARSFARAGEADVVLETTAAYWSLVTARANAVVWDEAIASFDSHLADARNRRDLGLAARNEVLAVEARRAEAELARIEARNAEETAEAELRRLTGVPPRARLEVEAAVAADDVLPEGEALIAAALESRPEVKAQQARVSAAEAAARAAGGARLPQAVLQAGWDHARPNPRLLPLADAWNDTWSVGIGVSYTPFDGGRTASAVAQARAEASAARAQLDDLVARVRLDVTSRVLDLAAAQAAIAVAERGLEAAGESLRVVQDRYREGLLTTTDRLEAEAALLRAGLQQKAAIARRELARARLERSVGR